MGLGLHEPRNWFNICAKKHPWSKLCNLTRLEAQIHRRLKVQRFVFVLLTVYYLWKKSFSSISHTSSWDQIFFFFFQEKYTRLLFSFWKNMTTKYISNSLFSWIKIKQHMPILFTARENKGYALKKHTVHFYTYPLLQRQVACIPPHGWVSFVFVLLRKPTLCQTTTNVFKFLNRVGIILFF